MSKYTVVGEGETVEILGVLRTPGDVLSLLPTDAEPHVADGSLVEITEEAPVVTPPAEPVAPATEENGIASAPAPETVGEPVVETGAVATDVTQPPVAETTTEVAPEATDAGAVTPAPEPTV